MQSKTVFLIIQDVIFQLCVAQHFISMLFVLYLSYRLSSLYPSSFGEPLERIYIN